MTGDVSSVSLNTSLVLVVNAADEFRPGMISTQLKEKCITMLLGQSYGFGVGWEKTRRFGGWSRTGRDNWTILRLSFVESFC